MSHLSAQLIALLRCPITGSPLVQQGETLVSTGTGEGGQAYRYEVSEGIPVLLAAAATEVPAAGRRQ